MLKIIDILINCFKTGHKILICGNGGSASQSNHFAAELVSKFFFERQALPAISLSSNQSIITAIANDYSFDNIFSRQVQALGQKGDVLIILSTSGKSRNCLKAKETAHKIGLDVIDFPRIGRNTAEIQEYQVKFMHKICYEVEKAFI